MKRKMMMYSFIGACALVGFAAFTSPAKADDFKDQIDKVDTLSSTISGIVSSMTTVAITPMGLGAAMKTFRHIVLMNV